jgi:hypothetical protein
VTAAASSPTTAALPASDTTSPTTEEDILALFTDALDTLGITWTRNSRHSIAVYRKAATARLDQFVGPKSAPRPNLTDQPLIPPKCS